MVRRPDQLTDSIHLTLYQSSKPKVAPVDRLALPLRPLILYSQLMWLDIPSAVSTR